MFYSQRVQLENELCEVVRNLENGIEMLVGRLSTLTTEKQLQVLLDYFKKENNV